MIASLLRLASGFAATTLLLTGCHYTGEEKWSVCCVLYVRADQAASDEARTVIKWHQQSDYDGNGKGGQGYYDEGKAFYSDKDDKIRADVASFLADDPEKRATDYFIGLGMTCGSYSTTSGAGGTRCQIALPVRVICGPTYRFLPSTTPIPERLKKPLAGVLHVSVDLPTGRALKTSSGVDPVPGGQLCHSIALRQHILKVGDSPFAHNYLVFYDDDGNVVGEFHGLATDPATEQFVPIGRSSDYLKARRFEGKNWFQASRRNPSGKARTTKPRHGGRRPGTRMTRSTAGA